ncbi:MAG: RIP metalloprotease RseP [Dehalococcoidia bacterium]|nr:MAG: RIP metalloprotease RseP [Dehalococcoidia bacterium]
MSVAVAIISFIAVLFFLVSSHEMGHFIAAKRAGIVVEEFGIGFPPRLFAIKRGETSYSINLIPLGAFVRTTGENDPTVPGGLASKGPWTRMGVFAAGPLVNVFLAFVFLSVFFMVPTETISGDGVMVHSTSVGSPAEEGGIEPGDVILRIGEQEIHQWEDVQEAINSNGEEEKALLLQRGGEQFELHLRPEFNSELNRYIIGILLCWGIVTEVEAGSPAEDAGIMPGDTILSINKQPIYSTQSMSDAISSAEPGEKIEVVLLRGEEILSKSLELSSQNGEQAIGLGTQWVSNTHIEKQRLPFWQAIHRGGDFVVHIPELIVESLDIIKEDPSKAVVGPVGAGQLTVEAVRSFGLSNVLFLGGLISMGFALFNFIPVPPLDGGGMLISLIEGVRRGKRLSPRTVRLAYAIGTALIITLFVLVFYSDILRLIRGEGFGL